MIFAVTTIQEHGCLQSARCSCKTHALEQGCCREHVNKLKGRIELYEDVREVLPALAPCIWLSSQTGSLELVVTRACLPAFTSCVMWRDGLHWARGGSFKTWCKTNWMWQNVKAPWAGGMGRASLLDGQRPAPSTGDI
ncbi:hypothetical protein WJX79_010161 [Trebouxia sp. C0005]